MDVGSRLVVVGGGLIVCSVRRRVYCSVRRGHRHAGISDRPPRGSGGDRAASWGVVWSYVGFPLD